MTQIIDGIQKKAIIDGIQKKAIIDGIQKKAIVDGIQKKAIIDGIQKKAIIDGIQKKAIIDGIQKKAIIDGIQKKGNQEKKRQLNLDNAFKVIKEKGAEILVYKDMEKRSSECDNVRRELEIKCEALELKLISEIKVNGTLEQKLEEKEITNKNIERALKEFDAMNKQLEKYDLSYLKNRSTSTHSNDMVELIDQLELLKHSNQDLAKRIEDQNLIVQKTELAFNTKNEMVEAKEEIIGNLKMIIEQLQKEISKQVSGDVNPILSNANVSSDQLTPGVADCIDFLKCHANNGVILNGLLIWVWIQRRTTADNI